LPRRPLEDASRAARGLSLRLGNHLAQWRHRSEWRRSGGSPNQADIITGHDEQLAGVSLPARLGHPRLLHRRQRPHGGARRLGSLVRTTKLPSVARLLPARRLVRRGDLSQRDTQEASVAPLGRLKETKGRLVHTSRPFFSTSRFFTKTEELEEHEVILPKRS